MVKFSFREVAPCLFAIFIDVLGFGLVAPLLISLFTSPAHNIFAIASPSLRYFCLGITLALYPLLMFFGTSFIGDLSDIIGRKKTLLFSMIGMAMGFFLMGLGVGIASFFLFLVGRGLSGLVAASQSVALATISDLSTKENKAIHLSYVALIQCIGFVVGPLMGGLLSSTVFYAPFFGAGLFAFIAFVWIAVGFKETNVKKSDKKISIARVLRVFVEAYQNQRIRDLSVAFFMMQVGIGLYFLVILILLSTEFGYAPWLLGFFNGYLGLGFAIGLAVVLPLCVKRFKIEQIVCFALCITLVAQFFTSLASAPVFLWLLGFPFAVAGEVAFSGMFTAFSNAADERSQGWAMGISVAVMAIAWAIAGFSSQLAPIFGPRVLIFIGSIFLVISTVLMQRYCRNLLRPL